MPTTPSTDTIETTTALLQAELPRLEEHQLALQKELAVVSERLESVRGALSALSALAATTVPRPRVSEEAEAEATLAGEPQAPTATEEPAPETAQESAPLPEPAQEPAAAAESTGTGGDTDTADTTTPADATETAPSTPRKPTSRAKRKAAPKAAAPQAATRRPAKKRTTTKAAKTAKPAAKPAKTTKAALDRQATKDKQAAPRKTAATVAQDTGGLTEQVIAILSGKAGTPLRARDVAHALGRDESAGAINTVRSTLDRLVATSRAHRAGRGLYQAPTG
ncbi:hypothetical protein AB0K02_21995 [Streptomyces sp. NPDC049597]|uniref:hypothetical protein n=1 Tax=Streptomyces sp. NPDC049597 TaxID=3155276 RepID=UPI0034470A6F